MSAPTLLILAAGLGTRYGGLKQLAPVGPGGELIIDYTLYDALQTGMGKVVFVLRRGMQEAFRQHIGRRIEREVETAYVFQEPTACLPPDLAKTTRSRPWGTGHALLVTREVIDTPFVVVNADDYYGRGSLERLVDFFVRAGQGDGRRCAMVGYRLKDTLSAYGTVSRGICRRTDEGKLVTITECRGLQADGEGVTSAEPGGETPRLTGEEWASMNLWGLTPDLFSFFAEGFHRFARDHARDDLSEFYLPAVMNDLVERGQVTVDVLETSDPWFGITYAQDRRAARRKIMGFIRQGHYPSPLWVSA